MKRLLRSALVSLLLVVPVLAWAADGYVTGNVNLRAGPDPGYPLITTIPAGTDVSVQGCTTGWEWCDVIAFGNRGWVAGNYIQYDYQGQNVLLPTYGAQIGIPIVSFVIGTYWNNYYRGRPFYGNRNYWYHRPYVRRPPPPPLRRPYVRPHGNSGPAHRPPAASRPATRPPARPAAGQRPPANVRPATRPAPRPAAANRPATRPAPQHAAPKPPASRGAANHAAKPAMKPAPKADKRKHDRGNEQGH